MPRFAVLYFFEDAMGYLQLGIVKCHLHDSANKHLQEWLSIYIYICVCVCFFLILLPVKGAEEKKQLCPKVLDGN